MESSPSGHDGADVDLLVYILDKEMIGMVTECLKGAGVHVERALPLSGIVGIRAPRWRIGELERLPGVKLVREAETYNLPPFDESFPQ